MAGNDELWYTIKFREDEQTLEEVRQTLNRLQEAKEALGSGEARKETSEFTEVLKEFNETNMEGIERLIELQQQIDAYRESLKSFRDAKKEGVELSKEERKTEVEVQAALKMSQKEYRDKQAELIATTQAVEGQTQSYAELVAENRNIAAEMRNLPLDDTTGRLEELKKMWAENNETLKEFDASVGDHRRNVGNYSEALSTAASALAVVQGPLGPLAGRLNSLNTTIRRAIPLLKGKAAGWRLVGRAMLGLLGIAVVAFLGAILGALRGLQPVLDQVALRVRQVSAAWSSFTDLVGSWLGMNERSNTSMWESIRLAEEMHRRQMELEEQKIRDITIMAELEEGIARLRREAEDELNTHEQRIDFMDQALRKTEELFDLQVERQTQIVEMMREELSWSVSTREEREKLAEQEAILIRLRAQQETQSRQLVRRRQTIINSLRVEEERRRRLIQAMRDEIREFERASRRRIEQMEHEARSIRETFQHGRLVDLARWQGNELLAIELERNKRIEDARSESNTRREALKEEEIDFMLALDKLYRERGMDEITALNTARIEAHQKFAGEYLALQQWLADREAQIQAEARATLRDIERREAEQQRDVRSELARMRLESDMRIAAAQEAIITGRDERIILLEKQQNQRRLDLQREFEERGFIEAEAGRLSREMAELEFEERLQRTKTEILEEELEKRLALEEAYADLFVNVSTAMFGDTKQVRIASAIIDTYTAINRALASADPPLSYVRAAAALSMGMANVRMIRDTEIGKGASMGSAVGGASSGPRGFEVINDEPDGAVARQVAEQAMQQQTEVSPTFVFQGDLHPEVMAIKVRQGNHMIETKTPSVKSRA